MERVMTIGRTNERNGNRIWEKGGKEINGRKRQREGRNGESNDDRTGK
jgi:hypothetical protein